jgi:hypothetical protein
LGHSVVLGPLQQLAHVHVLRQHGTRQIARMSLMKLSFTLFALCGTNMHVMRDECTCTCTLLNTGDIQGCTAAAVPAPLNAPAGCSTPAASK